MKITDYIKKIPKAELHLHIEGSFEPELMFEIAQRNKVEIPYQSVEEGNITGYGSEHLTFWQIVKYKYDRIGLLEYI